MRFLRIILLSVMAVAVTAAPLHIQSQSAHSKRKKKASKRRRYATAADIRKLKSIRKTFVASADLKAMAQQLLQARTPQAYAGVEAYAAKHKDDEAAPLAWLALGYAHLLDSDYDKALAAWRNTQPLAPLLGDVLDYLHASAYQGNKDPKSVITVLSSFEQRYPDSVLRHDAALLYANALTATGDAKQAIAFLERHRAPLRAETEFALGRAYQGAEQRDKAAAVYSRIYYEMPLTPEADIINSDLKSFTADATYDARFNRADLLLKGRRYAQAAAELSALAEQAPESKLTTVLGEQGVALYRDRKRDAAQKVLEQVLKSGRAAREARAQAYYVLAEIAREKDDTPRYLELLDQLRAEAPESPWLQETLFSAANMYLLKKDYETAILYYSEVAQRGRRGSHSARSHWKAAWLSYRIGRTDDARRLFEEHLKLYPLSDEVPAALYWRGRVAEADNDLPLARGCYAKLSDFYRNYYYALLARERMEKIGVENMATPPYVARLPRPAQPPQTWDSPDDNLRSRRAELLANAGLFDFAVKELQAAANGSPPWQAAAVAQMYAEAGNYRLAIETLKRAVPGYFTADIERLPRPVWELLFPRAYWDDLKKHAESNHLDPFLVASLVRQESEFAPAAISRANAVGLMQLLPKVGRSMAREEKLHNYSTEQLVQPATNLQLGTRFFRHMVERYNGQVEYALAAYNAGEDRVAEWRNTGGAFRDMAEFVESIPFTETRQYVQAIIRNMMVYRLLYPTG